MANPTGGAVVAGSATIGSAGLTLNINQSSHNAIINWQQFSIASGETTKFFVPSSSSATLNRVTGGNPSAIYGSLQSNGIVYLINPSGIVPVYSEVPIIQPGSWISIYGSNLASGITIWGGNFPTSLGGVSVSINGKLGYLWFVSPGQINLQAPDDTTSGCVNVQVNTLNGQANYAVDLQPQGPSLNLWPDGKHAVGLIYTASGFDYMAPAGSVSGVTTRAVKAGETISLYGVGFGPTKTAAPAGQLYSGPAVNNILDGVNVTIGGKNANVSFAGLVGEGLYQFNLVVPQVPSGDQLVQIGLQFSNPILADNAQTQTNIYIPVQ